MGRYKKYVCAGAAASDTLDFLLRALAVESVHDSRSRSYVKTLGQGE